MNAGEFYNYIIENFNLDGTSSRLVRNVIEYVEAQDFVSNLEVHDHLTALLDGAFGIEEHEIQQYCLRRDKA